jgi:MFS family permease
MDEREPDPDEQAQELEATTGFRASVSLLRGNRDFRRLFLASVISLGGDWFLFVAITSLLVETTGRAIDVGLAILAQELAFFIASPPAGVLVDRLDRRKLMIVCDLARIGVCLSFLFVGVDTIWLAYPLLALLSVFGAPFDPASTAATPNLVDPRDLPTANALNGSLWGTMLAVGAGLGGIVATVFGRETAFVIDAVSFGVSALLLVGIRRPFAEPREPDHEHPRMVDATVEVWHYARGDHRVLSLIGVKAGFGLAAGVLALIPVFGAEVFHRGEIGVGALMAARGVGALVGPFLGHRLSGEGHRRLFTAIGVALAVFGLAYMVLGLAPALWVAAITIFVAHLGGGAQWVLSTFGLQVLVPDHIRGRIFAVDFAMITLSLAISSLVASVVADAWGPRTAALLVGAMAVVWSIAWSVLTRSIRRRTAEDGFAARAVAPAPDAA